MSEIKDSSSLLQPKESRRKGKRRGEILYEKVAEHFREKIRENIFKAGEAMPSISVLAKSLGVNYRTVRTAIEHLESEGIVRQLPNKSPIVVNNNEVSQRCVFQFIRWHGDSFFLSVEKGICRYAQENKLAYNTISVNHQFDKYIEVLKNLGKEVNGLLLFPIGLDKDHHIVRKLLGRGIKVVFIDRIIEGLDVPSVMVDHFKGAHDATSFLFDKYGGPVYYLGERTSSTSAKYRFAGWQQAVNENIGFNDISKYIYDIETPDSIFVMTIDNLVSRSQELAMKLFKDCEKSATIQVFAYNDWAAQGLYAAANEVGREIGKDVFVIGFGNIPLCDRVHVSLSSVEQNSEEVGYLGAQILHRMMTDVTYKTFTHLVPVELKIRESS